MNRRREGGYSLMEVTVVLAVFGIFLYIVVVLTSEMRRQEAKYPVNMLAHPQVDAVLARLRRDVADTTFYYDEYVTGIPRSAQTLWVDTITQAGTSEVVLWDFRTPGEAHRRVYNSAKVQVSDWVANAVPAFALEPFDGPHGSNGIRITATDTSTTSRRAAIDEIIIPRPHP